MNKIINKIIKWSCITVILALVLFLSIKEINHQWFNNDNKKEYMPFVLIDKVTKDNYEDIEKIKIINLGHSSFKQSTIHKIEVYYKNEDVAYAYMDDIMYRTLQDKLLEESKKIYKEDGEEVFEDKKPKNHLMTNSQEYLTNGLSNTFGILSIFSSALWMFYIFNNFLLQKRAGSKNNKTSSMKQKSKLTFQDVAGNQ
ncbi:hypothetical protein [Candidatus Phytoplasma asteris]|uniref:Uncharacterized protein n=1 Tax=Candidatus Phytoplasma asteris TaxID=85620 RepID=A0ABZ3CG53_9MOLU